MASERSFRTMDTNFKGGTQTLHGSIVEKVFRWIFARDCMGSIWNNEHIFWPYSSWDRKLVMQIKKLEKVLFASLYSMIQENAFRIKYSFIGVIVDFFQVFAFTLSKDFGFGNEYELVFSFLLTPVQLLTWPAFEVIFWLVVVVIVSSFVVAYYVGHTFLQSDFTVVWPIKYMRTMVNLILSVLFIPILTVLVVPLKADPAGSGFLKHFIADKIVAWGTFVTPYAAVSILMIVIFVPFCLLMSLLSFEFAPNTKDYMARNSSWLDFVYLLLKTILVFVTNFAASDNISVIIRATIIFLATAFVLGYLIVFVPYYGRYMNVIRSSLFGALFGAAVSTAVKAYIGISVLVANNFSSMAVFGIHMGAALIFGGFGGVAMYARLASKTSGNPYRYVTRAGASTRSPSLNSPPGHSIQLKMQSPGTRRTKRNSESSASVQRALTASRTGNSMSSQTSKKKDTSSVVKSWRTLKNFYLASEMILRVLFLRLRPESDDTVHLADTVYQRMIDANRSVGALYIHYSNFLISYKNDWLAASAQLRKAEVIGCGFTQRWLCFGLYKRIDRSKRSVRMGQTGSVDLMKYVEFQHVFSQARKAHLESLKAMRTFWQILHDESGDRRQLPKMAKSQIAAGNAQSRAIRSYSKVISSFPNSPSLWRSYGSFLIDAVAETEEGSMALQTADELEERQTRQTHAVTRYQEVGQVGVGVSALSRIPEIGEEGDDDAIGAGTGGGAGAGGAHTSQDVKHEPDHENEDDQTSVHASLHSGDGSSIDRRSARTKSTTGTGATGSSSTSATTVSKRLLSQLSSGESVQRLNKRFIQSFFIFAILIIINFVVTSVLIDATTEQVKASNEVINFQMDAILGSVAVSELAIARYTNNSDLGLKDVTSWKILPAGWDGHYDLADKFVKSVANKTHQLFSGAQAVGWGIDEVWQSSKAQITTFPSQTIVPTGLKSAIDQWRLFSIDVIDTVIENKINPDEVFHLNAFPSSLWNGVNEIGGAGTILGDAYKKALDELTLMIQIVVSAVALLAVLTVIGLMWFIIRPTITISHLEEHLTHVLLLLVPHKYIEGILTHIMTQEMDLRVQLTETGGDDSDEDMAMRDVRDAKTGGAAGIAAEAIQNAEDAQKDGKRRKKKRHAFLKEDNLEGAIYKEAFEQQEKCKGLRKLHYMYTFGLFIVIVLIGVQCASLLITMSSNSVVSSAMIVAGNRLERGAECFAFTYWIPESMSEHVKEDWSTVGDPHKNMEHALNDMVDSHRDVIYGNKAKGIIDTKQYIEQNQKSLVDNTINPGMDEWTQAAMSILDANSSTLDYSAPGYATMQRLWDQPGKFKVGLEDSVLQYYTEILDSHKQMNDTNVVWLICELLAVVVVYFIFIKRVLSHLLDRDEAYLRTLKTIPARGVADVPLLMDYLRDKHAFIERIADRSTLQSDGGLDATWALSYIRSSPEAYIVVSGADDILEVNPAAEGLFKTSGKDLRGKNIEVIAAPRYRNALEAIVKSVKSNTVSHGSGSIMITCHDKAQTQMSANFTVRLLEKAEGNSHKNQTYVMVFMPEAGGDHVEGKKWEKAKLAAAAVSTFAESGKKSENTMWDSAPVMMLALDGSITSASPSAARLFEIDDPSELKKKNFSEVFGSKSRAEASGLLRGCLAAESREMSRVLTIQRPRGREGALKVTLVANSHSGTSDVRSMLALLDDRSDYVAMEHSLVMHERQHRELLKALPLGFIATDSDRKVVSFNSQASDLLGHARSSVLGQSITLLFIDPFETWADCAKDGKWARVVCRGQDGGRVVVECSVMQTDDTEVLLFIRGVEGDGDSITV